MFTLRFRRGDLGTVVAGAKYEVHKRREEQVTDEPSPVLNATITVYGKIGGESGYDYHINGPDTGMGKTEDGRGGFDVVFIENSAGKTIDRIGPFNRRAGALMTTSTLNSLANREQQAAEA